MCAKFEVARFRTTGVTQFKKILKLYRPVVSQKDTPEILT